MKFERNNMQWFTAIFALFLLVAGLFLLSCQSKPEEKSNAITVDSVAVRDSIISFEALFAHGKYNEFLNKYWSEECYNKWYAVAKALSMKLTCPCTGILPTISDNTLFISLNNTNCYPPEVEESGFVVGHDISVPLETLRPYLNETGERIVFESGTYLQDWLVVQNQLATLKPKEPYTLYISMLLSGKSLRVVLQSEDGPNDQEGSIKGYFENEDGNRTLVTGSRRWGGFIVYDPANISSTQIDFFWDDQDGDEKHMVRNRYLSALSGNNTFYINYVKLIGDFSQYEGPEDEYREPENGTPDF